MNQNILKLISQRNRAYDVWKKNKSDTHWKSFAVIRNKVNCSIRLTKKAYISKKLDSNLSPKALWKNLKNLGVVNSSSSECCSLDPDILANQFFFQ